MCPPCVNTSMCSKPLYPPARPSYNTIPHLREEQNWKKKNEKEEKLNHRSTSFFFFPIIIFLMPTKTVLYLYVFVTGLSDVWLYCLCVLYRTLGCLYLFTTCPPLLSYTSLIFISPSSSSFALFFFSPSQRADTQWFHQFLVSFLF